MKLHRCENVFIFGAGADKNFCDNNAHDSIPVGNDFVIKIFSKLRKTKELISDSSSVYSKIYNKFKKELSNKDIPNYMFDWKIYVTNAVKDGISKVEEWIFPVSEKDTENAKINIEGIILKIEKKHLEKIFNTDGSQDAEDARKFFIALLANIYGVSLVKTLKRKVLNEIKNSLKENLKYNIVKDEFFNDIEFPVYYNPEQVLIDLTKRIINEYITNESKLSEPKKIIYENYILNIFDYSIIFDNVYEVLLKTDNSNPAKVLRTVHFILAMEFTIKYYSEECKYENEKSYYRIIKNMFSNTNNTQHNCYVNLNYTDFLEKVLKDLDSPIYYIHGKIGEYLDLLNGNIIERDDNMEEFVVESLMVPNFVPQSKLKPIISLEMIERLYKTYEALKNAKRCLIVGFGFKRDDTHIVNMLKAALKYNKNLNIYIYSGKDVKNSRVYKELKYIDSRRIHEPVYYQEKSFKEFLEEILK